MARTVKEWIGKSDDSRPPNSVRLRVLERYGCRCYRSGIEIRDGVPFDLDHIVALINGGENRESNLAPILKDKHKEKTRKDVKERSTVRKKRVAALGDKTRRKHKWPTGRKIPKRANPWG